MSWNLSFITEKNLTEHVRATIQKYGVKLNSYDLNVNFSQTGNDNTKYCIF